MENTRRYVIVSSNGRPEYEYYLPILKWAWKKIGWEVIVLRPIELTPYREETITQCIRLYAPLLDVFGEDDLLMTSDADMIPLSDYWNPNPDEITIYGHDLTDYTQIPMCYIAMSFSKWKEVMGLSGTITQCLERDLSLSKALSENKEEWWGVDQDIITNKLSSFPITKIYRGKEEGSYLPKGRYDRDGMIIPTTLIDFHAPHFPNKYITEIKNILFLAFGEAPDFLNTNIMNKNNFLENVTDWGNHRVLLWEALEETQTGEVIEMGLGGESTPYLHEYCKANNRTLYSFEYDAEWLEQYKHFRSDNHIMVQLSDWDKAKDICPNPSVILIDHSPGERRIVDIERFKDIKGILVVHDTQTQPTAADYGYESVWPLFKYKADLKVEMNYDVDPPHNRTWASAVSNHYDLTKWRGLETGNPDYKIV